jgi:hypothetical protein
MQGASRHELIVVFLLRTLLGFFNFRLIYFNQSATRATLSVDEIVIDVSNPVLLLPTP